MDFHDSPRYRCKRPWTVDQESRDLQNVEERSWTGLSETQPDSSAGQHRAVPGTEITILNQNGGATATVQEGDQHR